MSLFPRKDVYISRHVVFYDFNFPYDEIFLANSSEVKNDVVLPMQIVPINILPSSSSEVLASTDQHQRYVSLPHTDLQQSESSSTKFLLNPNHVSSNPSVSAPAQNFSRPNSSSDLNPVHINATNPVQPLSTTSSSFPSDSSTETRYALNPNYHFSTQLQNPTSIHLMTTRSHTRSLKPKQPFTGLSAVSFSAESAPLLSTCVPSSVIEALNSPHWKSALQAEFDALKRNNTWTLVSPTSSMNIVG